MTEAQPLSADAADLLANLETLRRSGAARADPMRFQALEALARRLPQQSEAVQRLLQDKLRTGLADYGARAAAVQQAAAAEAERLLASQPALAAQLRQLQAAGDLRGLRRLAARGAATPACAPLAQLNAWLRSVSPGAADAAAQPVPELASARRFRQAWDRGRTVERVEQAVARKPANAGPLNSHALVLNALDLMRALSPDYLRRFVQQVETLQWLEQAAARPARPAPKAKAKAAKAARRDGPARTRKG